MFHLFPVSFMEKGGHFEYTSSKRNIFGTTISKATYVTGWNEDIPVIIRCKKGGNPYISAVQADNRKEGNERVLLLEQLWERIYKCLR